jgi:glycine cleavage system H protein
MNPQLDGSPELVNIEPYENGWMIKVKISNRDEISGLMNVEAYKSLIGA